ncbi:MAG: hypothetical protein ACT4QC_09275 [Planctomycetaceae bacterium]
MKSLLTLAFGLLLVALAGGCCCTPCCNPCSPCGAGYGGCGPAGCPAPTYPAGGIPAGAYYTPPCNGACAY